MDLVTFNQFTGDFMKSYFKTPPEGEETNLPCRRIPNNMCRYSLSTKLNSTTTTTTSHVGWTQSLTPKEQNMESEK